MRSVRANERLKVHRGIASIDAPADVAIYRPFFLCGVVSVLTAGCFLGAVALIGIAINRSYGSKEWLPYIAAHANSQLFGWVGFFVMGFALQQHKPSVRMLGVFYRMAYASLLLVGLGIVLRFVGEAYFDQSPGVCLKLGVLSAVSQAVGVTLFLANIGITRYRTGKGLGWQTLFVFTSLAWFAIVAWVEPVFFAYSHQSGERGLMFVARYFPPYREAQFLGFVTMMIFGVALVKMHECFGAKGARRTIGLVGFALWQIGLVSRMLGWVNQYENGFEGVWRTLYFASGWMLCAGALLLVVATRMFERIEPKFASHKFIRAALMWFFIAGVMAIGEPYHLRVIGEPFSHAFTGALRHAVTVGFISQMIVGVGMHVVTRMNDIPPSAEPRLTVPFVLLNVGNTMRVILEVATDYTPSAFVPMGATGVLELTALAWWGIYILKRVMPRLALQLR